MKEIFTIVLLIIGALIGAGFASGQEIYSFFYSYGAIGLIGIIITSSLMSLLIYKSLKLIRRNKIENYSEFLRTFIKNEKIIKIINLILNILLLTTFYIMIAGFGAYFEQEIGISRILGSLVLAILCAIVFFTSIKGVLKVSEYVVPILIIFIVIIGGINLLKGNVIDQVQIVKRGWFISAVTYCSYSLILIFPVLISIRKEITKETHIKYIAIISGIVMITLSVMIYMLLTKIDIDISKLEMPVVYVVRTYFTQFKPIYAFIILASIFTTAISIGTGFLQNISKTKKSYTQLVLFMCITSLLISNFGFSKLVNFAYPIFGYIGILQVFALISKK